MVKPTHQPLTDWHPAIIEEWNVLWHESAITKHIMDIHVPALRRLFTYRSNWLYVQEELKATETIVRGSRGNMVLNPLYRELRDLEGVIIKLEKEFGLTLRAAAQAGIELGQAELTWQALNAGRRNPAGEVEAQEPAALPVVGVEEVG